jgi:hypothetical protein
MKLHSRDKPLCTPIFLIKLKRKYSVEDYRE